MGRGRDEEGESGRERGERKTFLLPPLLTMKAISVMRRHEEREEGRARERWRRKFPPPSTYAGVCRMQDKRKEDVEERGVAREGEEREK